MPAAPRRPLPPTPNRVLIVRPSALGDVSRTVPVLTTLRRAWPEATIDWLINDELVDAVQHHPDLSGVVQFPRRRFGKFWHPRVMVEIQRWRRELVARRYDLVYDLQGLLRSGMITRSTRAPRRVGYRHARECASVGYNVKYDVDHELRTVDFMLGLLEADGLERVTDMRLYVGEADQAWFERTPVARLPYAIVAPMTRWPSKNWPLDRFGVIGRRMLDHAGALGMEKLVVLSAGNERDEVQTLVDRLGSDRVWHPTTTVGQMMALVSRASLIVCGDSAPLHIGVGFGRRIVSIFGPTDPAKVGPYHRPDAVIAPEGDLALKTGTYRHMKQDQTLISTITVDRVWQTIERVAAAEPAVVD